MFTLPGPDLVKVVNLEPSGPPHHLTSDCAFQTGIHARCKSPSSYRCSLSNYPMQWCCEILLKFVATRIISNFPIFHPDPSPLAHTRLTQAANIWGYLCSQLFWRPPLFVSTSLHKQIGSGETLQQLSARKVIEERNCSNSIQFEDFLHLREMLLDDVKLQKRSWKFVVRSRQSPSWRHSVTARSHNLSGLKIFVKSFLSSVIPGDLEPRKRSWTGRSWRFFVYFWYSTYFYSRIKRSLRSSWYELLSENVKL